MTTRFLRQAMISWMLFMTAAFVEGVFRTLFLESRLPAMAAEMVGIVAVLVTAGLIAYVVS